MADAARRRTVAGMLTPKVISLSPLPTAHTGAGLPVRFAAAGGARKS